MTSPVDSSSGLRKRTNQEWIYSLTGQLGIAEQYQAHVQFAHFLHKVAYTDLLKRREQIPSLRLLVAEELAALAQDFVQDILLKLTQNCFARLYQYRGEGSFVAWATQIVHRHIISELRKQRWRKQELLSDERWLVECSDSQNEPEALLQRNDVEQALSDALAQLPERQRIAFVRRVIDNERSEQVAAELQTSIGAVNVLVSRARQRVQQDLILQGLRPSVFKESTA